jgi:hypothetical protein
MGETPHGDLRKTARAADQQVTFLLEEYKLITESMLRNEESGEKRAAFFMALAGAAGTALSFAFSGDHALLPKGRLPAVAAGAAAVLLILGLMTLRRMAERHIVTDRYLYALREIRRTFISHSVAVAMKNTFFYSTYETREERKERKQSERRRRRMFSPHKGGWMECVAAVNALLAGACLAGLFVPRYENWRWWILVAIVVAITAWMLQIYFTTKYVAKEYDTLQADDDDHLRLAIPHAPATQGTK